MRVKMFNPKTMKESRITFIIGKRHTGKTVLLKDLLYNMPRPDYVVAMAPTEDTLQMFAEFLPHSCMFDHFSQEKLDRAVQLQKELVSRGKKRTLLILLDDCLYQKNVLRSTSMRHIFFNGRHDNISLICCAQYMMEVDPSLRTNIDYLFTMRENVLVNRQKLFKYYFGQFPKFDAFERVMAACTQDYRSLVLDGTISNAKEPTDSVMWYRASQSIPPFRLCKDVYWRMSEKYGISLEEVRRAQTRQFEMKKAADEAWAMGGGAVGVGAGGSGLTKKGGEDLVVQTENERGEVVTTCI